MMLRHLLLLAVVLLLPVTPVLAQGVQSGTVTGLVTSSDGAPLPGVTIVAMSPALQQERLTTSDVNGVYYLRTLPPGEYEVQFALDGFQAAMRTGVVVAVGGTTELDATLGVAAVTEVVTVTAEAPSPLAAPSTARNVAKTTIDALPVSRRPTDVAELAPGLTTNTYNAGQLAVSGAFGFDNLFMVNGVDTNDNVFGTQNNLFIEDAVQEVSVITSGAPASYGRFSGGVVNVITRSGGNSFSGSVRETLSNPQWVTETPRERQNGISHADVLGTTHEGTFGGPIRRDRLWFFAAGRYESAAIAGTFTQTAGAYTRTDTNRRGELKLTGTPAPGHTLQADYIVNHTRQANASGIPASRLVDASTLVTRTLPNAQLVASYSGVVANRVFATAQFSRKRQGFRGSGGSSAAIVDSPFLTLGAAAGVPGGLFYHAPYLDATDPEDRNNRQIAASVSYLLSSRSTGSHDLKAGVESFVNTAIGGNSQSSTGYVFAADYAVQSGRPVIGSDGRPVPVFVPGVSQAWNFQAVRGAQLDIRTTSLYLQDRWVATPRLTLDLGVRAEIVRGEATGDITTVDASSVMPRLAATVDLSGEGRTVLQATFGTYAGRYGQVQFATNTNVGRPSEVDYVYGGPAGRGRDFAPGFDLSNYTRVVFANFPTANIRVADDLESPLVTEATAALGRAIGQGGYAKATYVWRRTSRLVEDFVDLTTGTTTVPLVGTLTNRVLRNTSTPDRDYAAVVLEASHRSADRLTVTADYTLQVRNHGNFVGEGPSQPGIPSVFGNYPEVFGPDLDRLMPDGRLDSFQRHKLRVYGVLLQPLGRFGALDVAPLWRVNSGTAYSLTASVPLTAQQLARNPGYPSADVSPFVRQLVFFGERGAHEFKGYGLVDLALTYRVPLWRSVAPWAKVEFYNLFNNQKQIAWDRTVSADPSSARDASGLPTGYLRGPRFGQATADNQFPQPFAGQIGGRAFRMAFGVRF
ncbi:MAG: TonB-dependent receptor [Acidobacteria bacterium]|nr:TonB-dependent receptor [Acidobacteriota bacterium]